MTSVKKESRAFNCTCLSVCLFAKLMQKNVSRF